MGARYVFCLARFTDCAQGSRVCCWQIPAFYVYSRGRKVGEVVGAAPDALEVRAYCTFQYMQCVDAQSIEARSRSDGDGRSHRTPHPLMSN